MVITSEDLSKIKRNIRHNDAEISKLSQTRILANSMHEIVEESLNGIDAHYWGEIKQSLFKTILESKRCGISKRDIFLEILFIKTGQEEICKMASRWLIANTGESVDLNRLNTYVKQFLASHKSSAIVKIQKGVLKEEDNALALCYQWYPNAFITTLEDKVMNAWKLMSISLASIIMALVALAGWHLYESNQALMAQNKLIELARLEAVVNEKEIFQDQQGIKEIKFRDFTNKKLANQAAVKSVVTLATGVVPKLAPVTLNRGQKTERQLPEFMVYKAFDIEKLRKVLIGKRSKLAEPIYFESIIETAKAHDIDPRFLFAIAGQEQGLVDTNGEYALKMANNPFNVYGSWKRYNTNIKDSSEIACNTIVKRIGKWPGKGDPIAWLNKTYAADEKWGKGVSRYYRWLCAETQ